MDEQEFKWRTKGLAPKIIGVIDVLPETTIAQVISKQILRSATSIGANYRDACQAQSTAEILDTLAIVVEKANETLCWLELLVETELVPEAKLKSLMSEINEIISAIVASITIIHNRHNSYNPKLKKESA